MSDFEMFSIVLMILGIIVTVLVEEKMEDRISAVSILNDILDKYRLEMLDTGNSLSIAIYEYFSSKDFNDSENALTKQYINLVIPSKP